MQKTITISETINHSLQQVWGVLSHPSQLSLHGAVKTDVISDTEWIEHTNDSVQSHCIATVNAAEHKVEVKSENEKYKGEWDDIVISATDAGNNSTQVDVNITIATGAVFNMLAFKFFGDKMMKYSSSNIFEQIDKLLGQ